MRRLLVSRSSDIPVGMSVIRGTRALQSVSAAAKARLTAAYNRECGPLHTAEEAGGLRLHF